MQDNVFYNTITAFIVYFLLKYKLLGINVPLVNTAMNFRIP
jgi:hypothetical protein